MKTSRSKSFVKWGIAILLVLLGVVAIAIKGGYMPTPSFLQKRPAPTPIPATSRDERWQQAVEYLGTQLPYLHINPYFKVGEANFREQVSQLSREIPELNDEQIIVRMMKIVASIGDGHTRAYPEAEPLNYRSFPLAMRWLDDDLVVVAADAVYEQAVGAKVVQISGHPIQNVQEQINSLIAADNEMELLNNSPAYIAMPALLYGLGLIPDKDSASFQFESQDGSRFDLELRLTSNVEAFTSIYEKMDVPVPLYERNREAFYWYEYIADSNVLYVQYNVCSENEEESFESFTGEVFDVLEKHPDARLVLDVRYNGGGNETVLYPFVNEIKAHPQFDTAGQLFVIIGRATYSSALQNAITLQQESHAILVGEPTGGKPNHYGEVRYFNLPNVGLLVQYSTRYWLNYPGSDPATLEPDLPAVLTMSSLLTGKDPALEAIQSYP